MAVVNKLLPTKRFRTVRHDQAGKPFGERQQFAKLSDEPRGSPLLGPVAPKKKDSWPFAVVVCAKLCPWPVITPGLSGPHLLTGSPEPGASRLRHHSELQPAGVLSEETANCPG